MLMQEIRSVVTNYAVIGARLYRRVIQPCPAPFEAAVSTIDDQRCAA